VLPPLPPPGRTGLASGDGGWTSTSPTPLTTVMVRDDTSVRWPPSELLCGAAPVLALAPVPVFCASAIRMPASRSGPLGKAKGSWQSLTGMYKQVLHRSHLRTAERWFNDKATHAQKRDFKLIMKSVYAAQRLTTNQKHPHYGQSKIATEVFGRGILTDAVLPACTNWLCRAPAHLDRFRDTCCAIRSNSALVAGTTAADSHPDLLRQDPVPCFFMGADRCHLKTESELQATGHLPQPRVEKAIAPGRLRRKAERCVVQCTRRADSSPAVPRDYPPQGPEQGQGMLTHPPPNESGRWVPETETKASMERGLPEAGNTNHRAVAFVPGPTHPVQTSCPKYSVTEAVAVRHSEGPVRRFTSSGRKQRVAHPPTVVAPPSAPVDGSPTVSFQCPAESPARADGTPVEAANAVEDGTPGTMAKAVVAPKAPNRRSAAAPDPASVAASNPPNPDNDQAPRKALAQDRQSTPAACSKGGAPPAPAAAGAQRKTRRLQTKAHTLHPTAPYTQFFMEQVVLPESEYAFHSRRMSEIQSKLAGQNGPEIIEDWIRREHPPKYIWGAPADDF